MARMKAISIACAQKHRPQVSGSTIGKAQRRFAYSVMRLFTRFVALASEDSSAVFQCGLP